MKLLQTSIEKWSCFLFPVDDVDDDSRLLLVEGRIHEGCGGLYIQRIIILSSNPSSLLSQHTMMHTRNCFFFIYFFVFEYYRIPFSVFTLVDESGIFLTVVKVEQETPDKQETESDGYQCTTSNLRSLSSQSLQSFSY